MRVLVTRPLEDVGPLVAALEARGHEAVVEPMLSIERRADVSLPLPLDGVQALLFTSANGVRAFAELASERGLPVFAVGDASATAARDAGFATVESAGGDVADLARLVRVRLDPDKGALFHPAASQLAGDLQGALEDAGFTLHRAALYEAQPAVELSPALHRALAGGELGAAVFFSPRTARTFVGLVERADLSAACARVQAICLSKAVASRLAALTWARVWVAARPEQEAVLARLDEAAGAIGVGAADTSPSESDGALSAHDVIAGFGGIRPMASKLGVAVSTVQGWRERDSIPAARHAEIRAAAKKHGVHLDAPALAASDRGGDSPMTTPPPSSVATSAASAATKETKTPPREQPAPPRAPTARPALSAARLWGGFALGAVAVLAGAGLAIVGRDLWLPEPPAVSAEPADTAALAGLTERLAAMESALRERPADTGTGESEATLAALALVEEDLSALASRLDGLAADVTAAAAAPGTDPAAQSAALDEMQTHAAAQTAAMDGMQTHIEALAGRVDAFEAQLASLQNQLETVAVAGASSQAQTAGSATLALAVLQLRDAVRSSAPFAAELQAVRDLAASPAFANGADMGEAIALLAPYAHTGLPALAKLKADFPLTARAIVAQGKGAADEDWLAGVKRRISGLISVRPIGSVEGEGPAAMVARAEAALAADDLPGAVRELSALPDPAAAAAGDWLAGAEGQLAARTALTQLSRGLNARLESVSE
jgi:uroporphyrinogen-III synthase